MKFKTNPENVIRLLKSKPGVRQEKSRISPPHKYNPQGKPVIVNDGDKRLYEVGLGPYGSRYVGCVGITFFDGRPRLLAADARSIVNIQLRFRR